MTALLLDTHLWAWSLAQPATLSQNSVAVIAAADTICLSTVSLYEIAQKVRLGKWPEMAPHVDALEALLAERGVVAVPPTSQICIAAGLLDWPHRDPFDRMIAATVLELDLVLVSADTAFDTLPDLRRIW